MEPISTTYTFSRLCFVRFNQLCFFLMFRHSSAVVSAFLTHLVIICLNHFFSQHILNHIYHFSMFIVVIRVFVCCNIAIWSFSPLILFFHRMSFLSISQHPHILYLTLIKSFFISNNIHYLLYLILIKSFLFRISFINYYILFIWHNLDFFWIIDFTVIYYYCDIFLLIDLYYCFESFLLSTIQIFE